MTAMVDVAFLLLTFFVLTATMNKPSVMELNMPPKTDELPEDSTKIKVKEEKIMTLILDADDTVRYYVGITNPEVKATSFDPANGVRGAIQEHINWGLKRGLQLCVKVGDGKSTKNCWDPIFLIKPRVTSRYGNLVDLIDELNITEAPKYAITEFAEEDSLLLIGELEISE